MPRYPSRQGPDFCTDRGEQVGLPADMGPTEAVMAILDQTAFSPDPQWENYFTDLAWKLAREKDFDPWRGFTDSDIISINRHISPEGFLVKGSFYGSGLSHKSIAAMLIELGWTKDMMDIGITWADNYQVAIRHKGAGLGALDLACIRVDNRKNILREIVNDVRMVRGEDYLISEITKTVREALIYDVPPNYCKRGPRTIFPGHAITAHLLFLIGEGAKLNPCEWESHQQSVSRDESLAHLVALDSSHFRSDEKLQILKAIHAQGHPLEVPGNKIMQPLHLFVATNEGACAQFLLASGVDPRKRDSSGKTARAIALKKGYHDIAAMIDAAVAQHVIEKHSTAMDTAKTIKPLA